MAQPNDPISLKVLNRIVTVLRAITAGANYFYTPYQVSKRFVHWGEADGFPVYMVFRDSGGRIETSGTDLYDEDMTITIKGIIQDEEDTVTKMERAIRDVRKAINDDAKSGAAGSLGVLAVETRIEEAPETDNGYLSLEGYGYFDQKIRVKTCGDYDEL